MNRTLAAIAVLLLGAAGLTACATDAPASGLSTPPASSSTQESASSNGGDAVEPGTSNSVMPEGARPGSAEFPFPVPEDWPELMPFTEEKIGKALGMSASYEHPGDATSAAETYRQLLEKAGFDVHPNPLGEQVHAASIIAKGDIEGVDYSGTLDFDTDAENTPRVVINLTQD